MNPNPIVGQRWHYKWRDEFISEIVSDGKRLGNKVLISIKEEYRSSNPPGEIFWGADGVIRDFPNYWTLLPNQDIKNDFS
jgi:hypothetical protein